MKQVRATYVIDTDVEDGEDVNAVIQAVAIDLIRSGLEPVAVVVI